MNGKHFVFSDFSDANDVIAGFSWEKVDDVQAVEDFTTDAVDATNALNYSHGGFQGGYRS